MLSCGRVCHPTEVLREIERFPSSARPARVETDVGQGFIKGASNPQGLAALISELIAAELGTWLGLAIPPFAVLRTCNIEIPMLNNGSFITPPCFFSFAVDGETFDGTDGYLKRLSKPEDVAKIIIFDTWIRNADRYNSQDDKNYDNLLFVSTKKINTI
jgi:hypothetical protein